MSFDPLVKALEENPALAEELGNAKTPRERDAILDAHGIEKPNIDSKFPEAGGQSMSVITCLELGFGLAACRSAQVGIGRRPGSGSRLPPVRGDGTAL